MADNINNIIENLKQINEGNSKKFKLPNSGIEVSLKPLLAQHVSKINSSYLAGVGNGSYSVTFPITISNILNDVLTLPEGKSYQDFNLYDYYFILFKLRESINPVIEVVNEDSTTVFDVRDLQKMLKTKRKTTSKFGKKSCEIHISIPSYSKNLKYDKIISTRYKKDIDKEGRDIESISKDVFTYTLLKYVDKLSLVINNEPTEVSFDDFSPKQQYDLLDHIPNNDYKKLFDEIAKISQPIKNATQSVDGVSLPIDHTLFIDVD